MAGAKSPPYSTDGGGKAFSIILVVLDLYDSMTVPFALPAAIESLDLLAGNFELVLVNNSELSASPRTTEYLRKIAHERAHTTLVEVGYNSGTSAGFNRGVAVSNPSSRFLAYMSGDALVADPQMLFRLERTFSEHPEIGLVHPVSIHEDSEAFNFSRRYSGAAYRATVRFGDGSERAIFTDFKAEEIARVVRVVTSRTLGPRHPMPHVPLTFMAVRKEVYQAVGGFDEMFTGGYEIDDFALRALELGIHSALVRNAFILHRRLLFRTLGQFGKHGDVFLDSYKRMKEYWVQKWGQEPIEVYRDLRYGSTVHRWIIRPAVRLRSLLADVSRPFRRLAAVILSAHR